MMEPQKKRALIAALRHELVTNGNQPFVLNTPYAHMLGELLDDWAKGMDEPEEAMAEHFQAVLDRVNNAELPRVADVPEPTAVAGRLNPDRIRLYYLETKLAKVRQWAAPENEESQDEYASLRAILDEP